MGRAMPIVGVWQDIPGADPVVKDYSRVGSLARAIPTSALIVVLVHFVSDNGSEAPVILPWLHRG